MHCAAKVLYCIDKRGMIWQEKKINVGVLVLLLLYRQCKIC
nr:MAG TPA: hypothetical protein [Caudoviricetes sp.]DAV91157.1 MAG TPA: hypothetical protein [Caudoviricetes sp.]